MRKLLTSLALVLFVFINFNLKANTSDKTNNLLKHLDYLYKNFPLGIAQKDFKNIIPSNWSTTDRMHSQKQNVNPAGDINNGYFFYELKTNDLYYPLLQFQFWEKKLVNIDITIFAHDLEDSAINNVIFKNQIEKFNTLYNNPVNIEDSGVYQKFEWEKDKHSITLRMNPKDENDSAQVGVLEIYIKNSENYKAMKEFTSIRNSVKLYDEYYASIMCEQKLQSGTIFEFGFFYDTRLLSEEKANEYKNTMQKSISNENINCMSELTQVSEFDKEWLDITLPSQKSVMDTYLSFKTLDGINAWGQFFAGEYTDAVCENYQKILIQSGIEAECVYGHDIK